MDIKGKVVVITGASHGIGEAIAKNAAARGAKLVLAARSADKIKELAAQLPDAAAVTTDMRNPNDIQALIDQAVAKYGRVDVLVNNAGQGLYSPVEKVDLAQYHDVMELNVFGVLRAMQAVIPQMRKQGGGTILNVSSRVSQNYYPNLAAYASTKYALNALSLTARTELAPDGIQVCVFHPRMTATDFGKNSVGERLSFSSARPNVNGQPIPVDTAEQVAEKIVDQIESGTAEEGM